MSSTATNSTFIFSAAVAGGAANRTRQPAATATTAGCSRGRVRDTVYLRRDSTCTPGGRAGGSLSYKRCGAETHERNRDRSGAAPPGSRGRSPAVVVTNGDRSAGVGSGRLRGGADGPLPLEDRAMRTIPGVAILVLAVAAGSGQ